MHDVSEFRNDLKICVAVEFVPINGIFQVTQSGKSQTISVRIIRHVIRMAGCPCTERGEEVK